MSIMQERGRRAEDIASLYLQRQGLVLVERNFQCYQGELDLIMLDRDCFVFVEVRLRGRIDYGSPIDTISRGKQRKMIRAASIYLQKKQLLHRISSRFDCVGLHPKEGKMQIEWIKNAFWDVIK